MTVYILEVFFIAVFGLSIKPYLNNHRRRIYLVCVFFVLTTVSGLRGLSVGADTSVYVRLYHNIDLVDFFNTGYELGFIAFLKLLHLISENPQFYLFVSSAICVGSACLFTYHYSKETILSMMLYVLMGSYFSQMNVARQAIALSVTMLALGIVLKSDSRKRKIVAALLILLASTFHTISLLTYIPFSLIVFKSLLTKEEQITAERGFLRSILFAIIGFLGYAFLVRISTVLFPKYVNYFSSTWSDSNYNASLFNSLIALSFMVFGAVIFKNRKLDSTQAFGVIMVSFFFVFSVLSMRMEIWSRVSGFFGIYTYLYWTPEFINAAHSAKQKRILKDIIILAAFAYMIVVLTFRPEWSGVVPYKIYRP